MNCVGQTETRIILNVVDNNCNFVGVSGVGAHGAHSLLNKKS